METPHFAGSISVQEITVGSEIIIIKLTESDRDRFLQLMKGRKERFDVEINRYRFRFEFNRNIGDVSIEDEIIYFRTNLPDYNEILDSVSELDEMDNFHIHLEPVFICGLNVRDFVIELCN